MGRTFEVLGGRNGRTRKSVVAADAADAIPFPTMEPAPEPEPVALVPVDSEDLPGDDNEVPHIEVGGPRAKTETPSQAPTHTPTMNVPLVAVPIAPTSIVDPLPLVVPQVAFHLLPSRPESTPGPSPDLIAYHRPEHPTSRQFRQLADGIAAQHRESRSPVLFFTSASSREACGTTVINLAAIRAAEGSGRILVIEAERAPGSSAERLGAASLPGLRELLARTVPLALGIHRTAIDGVHVIPEGKTRLGHEEGRRLPALLEQLRHRFDWIIVDGPIWNVQTLTDWTVASDSVYLVLKPDEWSSPHADAAAEGIQAIGGRLSGCVTTG